MAKLSDNIKSMFGDDSRDLNPLSYAHILDDIKNFRNQRDGNYIGSQFDDPCKFYFKVFFYFNNSQRGEMGNSNLLGPGFLPGEDWAWGTTGEGDKKHSYGTNADVIWNDYKNFSNTASNYLISMGEFDRHSELTTFVSLLSNISCETPWMIQEVSGLKDVLAGYIHPTTGFTIPDDVKSISLKMLQEPYDMRVSTMLNAYRDAVMDKYRKLIIVPENLRKFDMGIYIFPAPYYHFNRTENVAVGGLKPSQNYYKSGSLYIELLDCEFDVLNGYDVLDTLNIADGNYFEYNINITVGQAFLTNYNEFLDSCVGDYFVSSDTQTLNNDATANDLYNLNKGILSKMLGQVTQLGKNKLKNFVNKISLGNMYGLSPKSVIDNITSGNVGIQSFGQIRRTMADLGLRPMNKKGIIRNMYDNASDGVNRAVRRTMDWDTAGRNVKKKISGYETARAAAEAGVNPSQFGFKKLKLSGYEKKDEK